MSHSTPMQDIRLLCNLYITDVPKSDVLALFITIAVINAVIFFSLWLPLVISLNIQSHHRLKRLSGILLRHRLVRFFVWPFLHVSCAFSLILEALVLHAGLACTHPGVEKSFYSLTPWAGWLLYATQCTILVISFFTIGICLRKEQKRLRKGKGRATAGGEDVEQHDTEPFSIPLREGSFGTSRALGREDNHHRPSTVITKSSASSRPEYICWEGIEDLTKIPYNMVPNFRTRDGRDVDPAFRYAMGRRTMGRRSDKITMEDIQHPKRVRLPMGKNAEGSSKDVERLVERRNALAAYVERFPSPSVLPDRPPPPRFLNRAGVLRKNGKYIELASEPFEGHSGRPLENRRPAPMGKGSFVPRRPSPLRTDSGHLLMNDSAKATVPGRCRLDKLQCKGKLSENVVFEFGVPPNEDVLISLSRITTSSSTSGLEHLQRCSRVPLPITGPMSTDSGVGLNEL